MNMQTAHLPATTSTPPTQQEILKLFFCLEPKIEIKNTYEFNRLVNVGVQLESQVKLCSDFLENAVSFARILQPTNVAQFCCYLKYVQAQFIKLRNFKSINYDIVLKDVPSSQRESKKKWAGIYLFFC
jgi:hypothetical protein